MAFIHNVEISWNDLMDAFASGTHDRVYFLDRFTGEIFFVPAALEDQDFWRQVETHHERFLEIPPLDTGSEKKIMTGFIDSVENPELKKMLLHARSAQKPYGTVTDILSFFPEEHEKLQEMKDDFVTNKVKNWLEAHDLFTMETSVMMPMSPV